MRVFSSWLDESVHGGESSDPGALKSGAANGGSVA